MLGVPRQIAVHRVGNRSMAIPAVVSRNKRAFGPDETIMLNVVDELMDGPADQRSSEQRKNAHPSRPRCRNGNDRNRHQLSAQEPVVPGPWLSAQRAQSFHLAAVGFPVLPDHRSNDECQNILTAARGCAIAVSGDIAVMNLNVEYRERGIPHERKESAG